MEGGGGENPSLPSPSPLISFFLLSSKLSRRTRTETLAMQANTLVDYLFSITHSHSLNWSLIILDDLQSFAWLPFYFSKIFWLVICI